MVNRTLALSLALALWPAAALAITPTHRAGTGERELASGQVLRPVHPHAWRAQAPSGHERAWTALAGELGSAWATWEGEAPRQIIATGHHAPGSVASAAEAERVARALLERHVELLAPGASASDLVLVANELSRGIRSVGFAQRSLGREVVGGQIGFAFAHDRLVMITSTAEPHVLAPTLLDGVGPDMAVCRNEVFGPVVGVAAYDSFDDAWRDYRMATAYLIVLPVITLMGWDAMPERSRQLCLKLTERAVATIDETDALKVFE